MLDLIVRDATNGARSIDDVMRAMLERFSGARGFTGRDVERTVADVCACNVHTFFEAHVRGAKPIDFYHYLRLIGMRTHVSWTPALGRDGQPTPDLRLYAWQPPAERALSLVITNPAGAWGRAGRSGQGVRVPGPAAGQRPAGRQQPRPGVEPCLKRARSLHGLDPPVPDLHFLLDRRHLCDLEDKSRRRHCLLERVPLSDVELGGVAHQRELRLLIVPQRHAPRRFGAREAAADPTGAR